MGYARANPHQIRGRLMPVIVYDPAAGRARLLDHDAEAPRYVARAPPSASVAGPGNGAISAATATERDYDGEQVEHARVAAGPLDARGEQQRADGRCQHRHRLRRALDAPEMRAAVDPRPDAEEQHHHEAAAEPHRRGPRHHLAIVVTCGNAASPAASTNSEIASSRSNDIAPRSQPPTKLPASAVIAVTTSVW